MLMNGVFGKERVVPFKGEGGEPRICERRPEMSIVFTSNGSAVCSSTGFVDGVCVDA